MDYELEPERPEADPSVDDARSTEHHESLLRDEAARASRTNRILGSFVVVGLAAATVMGVVTWQNASPNHDDGPVNVEDAAADGRMSTDRPSPSTGNTDDGASDTDDASATDSRGRPSDPSDSVSAQGENITPLTADQYAPPNAWSGDQFITPGQSPEEDLSTPEETMSGGNGETTGEQTNETAPDEGSSGREYPSLTDLLPSIPGLPSRPGEFGDGDAPGSTEATEPTEPTDPEEPSEPTEPTEPTETTGPSAPAVPTESEGSGASAPATDRANESDRTDGADAVTDTTGPSPSRGAAS